jgi:hypothetical protein
VCVCVGCLRQFRRDDLTRSRVGIRRSFGTVYLKSRHWLTFEASKTSSLSPSTFGTVLGIRRSFGTVYLKSRHWLTFEASKTSSLSPSTFGTVYLKVVTGSLRGFENFFSLTVTSSSEGSTSTRELFDPSQKGQYNSTVLNCCGFCFACGKYSWKSTTSHR